MSEQDYILWFDDIRMDDVERVGGKNASLGEMYTQAAASMSPMVSPPPPRPSATS